ncbi:MAG: hypothetical protein BroJett013_05120 [Alphaproteobacteria bacterium]|nr:MAG: hypothetical protein BroJett013_05120 [Alphaproteobacteria bacterium]
MRRLIDYALSLELERESYTPYAGAIFKDEWKRVAKDLHVRFFKQPVESFKHGVYDHQQSYTRFVRGAPIGPLFDFVEFLLRQVGCSGQLESDLVSAFVDARAAYRVMDGLVTAIGTHEQAVAFERAVVDAEAKAASGARRHLIDAGVALRSGDWAGSVLNSIHAVESVSVRLAPGMKELGPALKVLEQRGHLHGGLKSAFGSLYGYASDQEGVRHALVFTDDAKVDETDALFMLGVCAAFVSFVLARNPA